jgi:sulfur carrier protein
MLERGLFMTIVVAGERKEYADGLTVEELIEAEKVETPQYVTVTVNDTFLSNAERASRSLQEGDVVEFLYFMGGGTIPSLCATND